MRQRDSCKVAIKEAIQTINRMQSDGVIERYAIGGAVGATFYLEPVATLDIDIFVEFQTEPGSRIVSLEHIFKYLGNRGCRMEGDYVVIGNWPVQFLPAGSPLLQESLATAVEKDVEDTPVRVFTPEHIVAIALATMQNSSCTIGKSGATKKIARRNAARGAEIGYHYQHEL